VSSVSYVLTNSVNTYQGTIDVSTSSAISFVIAGVAAGSGYSIMITLLTDDGHVTCNGSRGTGISSAGVDNGAPFAVESRQSTFVNVPLICVDPAGQDSGSVLVAGTVSCCPTWDTAVAAPSGPLCIAPPRNTTTLTANAVTPCDGGDGGVNDLSCVWSVKTGTGVMGNTAKDGQGDFLATFTCPSLVEDDIVQLDCMDGSLANGSSCPADLTHAEISITCNCPPACTNPGESGVVASPDTAVGACSGLDPQTGNPLVNSGIADFAGDFCCVPACGGGPVASPFAGTGSCSAFPGTSNDGTGCCTM
jgi:hypothetical protein